MKTTDQKRQCYYIDPDQDRDRHGGYIPSLVVEFDAGHSPMLGDGSPFSQPWVWGKTLEEAQAVCVSANAERGVSESDAWEIIMTSIVAGRN